MDQFLSLLRIAGASFPGSASLVQLQAELDTKELRRRIEGLEDPIGQVHPDVDDLGRTLYDEVASSGTTKVTLPGELYLRFSWALAALEAAGLVVGGHALGQRYQDGVRITDPTFLLYLARAFGDAPALEHLIAAVDQCVVGRWLDGSQLAQDMSLPLPVVNAVFRVYEAKGYGLVSKTIGESRYRGMA